MKKNGKNIKCKKCNKEFYISASRFGVKKYCSVECARSDNFGFKPREKKCCICEASFLIEHGYQMQKKTCSDNCHYELSKQISKKHAEKQRNTIRKKKCKQCKNVFEYTALFNKVFCSNECQYENYKMMRVGKKNPNYKNGKYTKDNWQGRKSKTAYKHLNECRRYKKEFLKKHEYQFCEICSVNKLGTMRFEVHHIYFASKNPKHKNLHNNKNLIMLCIECHYKFHNGKEYKDKFLKLEKERGLIELFKR